MSDIVDYKRLKRSLKVVLRLVAFIIAMQIVLSGAVWLMFTLGPYAFVVPTIATLIAALWYFY